MEEERKSSGFNRICVFRGSSSGKKPSCQEAAIELGKELITGKPGGEVRAVSDMHQQKPKWPARPMCLSLFPHAVTTLGGFGAMEELLEVITWPSLGIHKKSVGLLNVDGFYNSLLSFIDKAIDEGFIAPTSRCIIISAPTAKELVLQLEEYETEYDEVTVKLVWEEVDRLGFAVEG